MSGSDIIGRCILLELGTTKLVNNGEIIVWRGGERERER